MTEPEGTHTCLVQSLPHVWDAQTLHHLPPLPHFQPSAPEAASGQLCCLSAYPHQRHVEAEDPALT